MQNSPSHSFGTWKSQITCLVISCLVVSSFAWSETKLPVVGCCCQCFASASAVVAIVVVVVVVVVVVTLPFRNLSHFDVLNNPNLPLAINRFVRGRKKQTVLLFNWNAIVVTKPDPFAHRNRIEVDMGLQTKQCHDTCTLKKWTWSSLYRFG